LFEESTHNLRVVEKVQSKKAAPDRECNSTLSFSS
jgi:hypothetical protein